VSSFTRKPSAFQFDHITENPPSGSIDGSNLVFTTAQEFVPGTLAVYLSEGRLNESAFTVAVNNQGFTIVLTPNSPHGPLQPPCPGEPFLVDYLAKKAACI